jgi:SAM-dependent methyltransferase
MERNLELIAKSYDRHFIEHGKQDALSYDNLPDYIINDPDYFKWKAEYEGENIDSESIIDIKNYLLPDKGMQFIQLGCSVNLMNKGYDKWPSIYHGVDISNETIKLLNKYVVDKKLSIGSLHCGSVHDTPFDDNYFDVGECIGVLEYYERDFIKDIITEIHRIMKPNGKFVLDIPNIQSSSGRVMMLIEECMGRPDKFNLLPQEFEDMIEKHFDIEKSNRFYAESYGYMAMVYCLRCI